MKINRFSRAISATCFAAAALLTGCGGGGGSSPPPPPGTLSGTVTTGSNPATALTGVSVIAFNASTNAPAATAVQTSATGAYSFTLNAGSYYLKFYKQGYDPIPSAMLTPVPLTVNSGATTTDNVLMSSSALTNTGWITGTVTSGTTGIGGVLVAAEATGVAYTSFTDQSGNYAIYNVPAAGYTVKAYIKGYSSSAPATTVTANAAVTADLALTANAAGTVAAGFNLISQTGVTTPANMVTSLVHPITKETIPGLSVSQPFSPSINYAFSGVADGTYIVRTTYANDTIVVDPDAIVKFGEPTVTVASAVSTPNPVAIKATSAVGLVSPTNALATTAPAPVTSTTPTFTWNAYPSTSDYVIEVMDASTGVVIWGGFTGMGTAGVAKNIVIPSSQTSIAYNSDGKASAPLVSGKTYRWRIYASKNDNSTIGWSLISMSEDQMGLITIQ